MDLLNWLRGLGCTCPVRECLTRQRGWKRKMSFSPQIVLPSCELDHYFGTALLGASGSSALFNAPKSQGIRQWHVITVSESWPLKRKRGVSDGKNCTSYFCLSVLRQENHLLQLELWKKAQCQKAEVSVWLISEYYLIFRCIENKGMCYQNILSDFHLLRFWLFYPLALQNGLTNLGPRRQMEGGGGHTWSLAKHFPG